MNNEDNGIYTAIWVYYSKMNKGDSAFAVKSRRALDLLIEAGVQFSSRPAKNSEDIGIIFNEGYKTRTIIKLESSEMSFIESNLQKLKRYQDSIAKHSPH